MASTTLTPTNSNIDNILGNSSEIDQAFSDMSNKFFSGSEDLYKTGLYGWARTSFNHVVKQSVYHKNTLYKEFFNNTAKMQQTLLSRAVDYQVEIIHSRPSYSRVVLGLEMEVIKKKATNTTNIESFYSFRLERFETKILIGNQVFSLPYSVIISYSSDSFGFKAEYDIEETKLDINHAIDYTTSPYLNVSISSIDSTFYVFLTMDLYQYDTEIMEYEMISANLSDRILYKIPYSGQLTDIQAYYTDDKYKNFPLVKYLNNKVDQADNSSPYLLYTYGNQNFYYIFFNTIASEFVPKYNSKLKIYTLTSKGALGNFDYTGLITMTSTDPDVANAKYMITLNSQPRGGKDYASLKDLKGQIFNAMKKIETLSTNDDINTYFNILMKEVFNTKSELMFVKSEDDVLRRLYNGYVKLTDKFNNILPTNTITLSTSVLELSQNDYTLKTGTLIVYDEIESKYRLLAPNEYPEDILEKKNLFIYSLPYLMKLKFLPYERAATYNLTIDKTYILRYGDISPYNLNALTLTGLSFKRNPVVDDKIRMSFHASINDLELGFTPTSDNIKIYGILKNPELLDVYGYMEFTKISSMGLLSNEYEAFLNVEDSINDKNQILVKESLYNLTTNSLISEIYLPEKLDVELLVFVNDGKNIKPDILEYANITGSEGYSYQFTVNTNEKINIFHSYNDVITTDVSVSNNGAIEIKYLPVIGTDIYFDYSKFNEIIIQLTTFLSTVKSSFQKIRNNTELSIKFFNTYGISKHTNSSTTNISINLDIKTRTIYNKDLGDRIKAAIKNYIDENSLVKEEELIFAVSNLKTHLENSFPEIQYINFKSLNGNDMQEIHKLYSLEELQKRYIEEPPECITVNKKTIANTNIKVDDINIKYI